MTTTEQTLRNLLDDALADGRAAIDLRNKRIADLEVENTRLRAALRRCNDAATEAGNDTRHTFYQREVARGIGAIIRKEMAGLGME